MHYKIEKSLWHIKLRFCTSSNHNWHSADIRRNFQCSTKASTLDQNVATIIPHKRDNCAPVKKLDM